MLELIKELCEINGTSGREDKIRDFIISKIKGNCEYKIDALGNIIAFKTGKNKPKSKIMLDAHMDEVGFIITEITDKGYLRFSHVGGIDSKVYIGRECVVGDDEINGIFDIKAVHLTKKDNELNIPDISDLVIDIGATCKEEAEKYVKLGDSAYFSSDFISFGDNFIKSKALDDRVGCAILIDMINSEIEYDMYFTFTVQEEIGGSGAAVASFSVSPDIAIVIETTTAADIDNASGSDRVCVCGDGPTISFMDGSTVYNRELYKTAFSVAKQNNIKCQPKTRVAGGNNSGKIHKSGKGVKTVAVSVPCRYLHSPSCVIKTDDIIESKKLIVKLANELCAM